MVAGAQTTTKVRRQADATLEAHEIKTLLAMPDRRGWKGKRAAALLAVLSYGLRIGEAVTLRVSQVKKDKNGCLELRDVKTLKRADHKRSIVLDDIASEYLRDWVTASGSKLYVFPGRRDHLSVDAAEEIVDRYLKVLRPECTAHNLRHSFCTDVVRHTDSIWLAAKMAGHSDIRLTDRRYAHASLKDARTVANALGQARRQRAPYGSKVGVKTAKEGAQQASRLRTGN